MAEEFKPEPIMNCSSRATDDISKLANDIKEKGMYANATDFPNIPIAVDEYSDDLADYDKYRNTSKGNSDNIKLRNSFRSTVFGYLKENLKYAKLICGNNTDLIIKSGYPSSQPPEAATVPLMRNIKTIVKGPEDNMVTVILEKAEGTKKQRRERKTYIVRVYLTETAAEFTDGCVSSNSRKLQVRNVPKDVARWYQLVIKNTAGSIETATRVKFTLS
jgi:hypothetical protein